MRGRAGRGARAFSSSFVLSKGFGGLVPASCLRAAKKFVKVEQIR